jgi:prepilin-type N-terminal cleavage/methylation domain-containing protein
MKYLPKIPRRSSRRGFTLIELIMTSVLAAMVMMAVYSVYSAGISVWQATYNSGSEETIYVALDRFFREISSALNFSQGEFTCTEHRLAFPALVIPTRPAEDRDSEAITMTPIARLGWITYYFDAEKGELRRLQGVHGEKVDDEKSLVILSEVKELAFSKSDRESPPQSQQEVNILPLSVKIEIKTKDSSFTRTVYLPVAQPAPAEQRPQ